MAVEILDIDYFKQYNDNYGHQKGDLCICRVAKEIQKLAEKDDIFCARYGGDEFILIYEGYSREAVVILTEKLKRSIRDLNMEHAFQRHSAMYPFPRESVMIYRMRTER